MGGIHTAIAFDSVTGVWDEEQLRGWCVCVERWGAPSFRQLSGAEEVVDGVDDRLAIRSERDPLLVRIVDEADRKGQLSLARAGLKSGDLADLLMRSASGEGAHTKSVAAHRRNVEVLVRALVRGLTSG